MDDARTSVLKYQLVITEQQAQLCGIASRCPPYQIIRAS